MTSSLLLPSLDGVLPRYQYIDKHWHQHLGICKDPANNQSKQFHEPRHCGIVRNTRM